MSEHDEKVAEEVVEKIEVNEEEHAEDSWTEEFIVAGEELVGFVKNLLHETTVRRLVVKSEKHRIHLEIPLVLGVAGIALLPIFSALALIAALVTDCTILVERAGEKAPEETAE